MIPVFENPAEAEKSVKEALSFPPFIMMENASRSLSEKILEVWDSTESDFENVIFLCGKGNNGADGLAAARMLYGKIPVYIYCPDFPKTEEGLIQTKMCRNLKIPFLSDNQIIKTLSSKSQKIICDCVFGTGFHGEIPEAWKKILEAANNSNALRIACDISSGLSFNAHMTVTMGTWKTALLSDKAKQVSGDITVSDLGIKQEMFNKAAGKTSCFIIEERDIKLPFRKESSSHKGTYGHSVVIAGEKSGAAVLSAEAAMNFGSGLTTILESPFSNLKQFKISPELMISGTIPKTCKALQIGSGLGDTLSENVRNIISTFETWFCKAKNPSCVIDADMFSFKELPELLNTLNKVPEARIVLTPHAKELFLLTQSVLPDFAEKKQITDATSALENRIEIGRAFSKKYPDTVLVMKGANTFIAHKGETFIFKDGPQSLSKGGSGDVLAGMITSLLAQGYTAKDAAITAVFRHGFAASEYGKKAYNLTAKKLISLL